MKLLLEGDLFELLPGCSDATCLIADPPDAIGLKYKNSRDKMSAAEYENFMWDCLTLFKKKAPTVWVSYNAKWTYLVGHLVHSILEDDSSLEAKSFIQTVSFGQNNRYDCGNGHRPILRLKKKEAPVYPNQIRVPSWRLLNGDKRANPEGCVPLDVWNFPRVTGNSKQRRKWHPTQLHEGLITRMINLSTKEGDTVFDAFSGTGTTMRVCEHLNRDVVAFESDTFYCKKLREEHTC